jgi:hypothetical protein
MLALQAAYDRRRGVKMHGRADRALAAALANYRVLLVKRLGPTWADALRPVSPRLPRTSKAPPPAIGLVRDYGPG